MTDRLAELLAELHAASVALRATSPADPAYPELLRAAQMAADAVTAQLRQPRADHLSAEDGPTDA